jgi:hypothetical protein
LAEIKLSKEDKKMLLHLEEHLSKTIKFGGKTGKQARVDGCGGTLNQTESWMKKNNIPFYYWEHLFKATGGYCDCEVLMNSFYAMGVHKE